MNTKFRDTIYAQRITRTTTQSPDGAHVGTNHTTHPFKRDGVVIGKIG
jgi:hypothetical protein